MNINQTVALNLSEAIAPPTLRMAQDDANTRTIKASLWDGAQPFSIPTECVCMVRFGKPDGTGGLYDTTEGGQKVSYSGNVVTAPVAAQMLAVAGAVKAQIDIYGGGEKQQAEKLATFRFRVEVEPSAYADAKIISSDYYNILSSQIAAAVEAGAKADQAIQAAQQAVEAASSASQSQTAAASSAQSASQSAQTASSAASSATSAKTAAESAQESAQTAKESAASSASSAAQDAQSASQAAAAAMQDADDAEAWAVGKRNGADVPSTDPTYHNNAKYYKDQAQAVVGDKVDSFNGRTGAVAPQEGDYTAEMVGAQPLLTPGDNISITDNTIATKAFPCNPNLLDNWYFGNPVNQRGGHIVPAGTPYFVPGNPTQSGVLSSTATVIGYLSSSGQLYPQVKVGSETYITSIGTDILGYVGAGGSIDRWKLQNDTNLTVGNGFCTLNGSWDIRQLLENLPQATYTVSVLFKNSTATALQILLGPKTTGADESIAVSRDASGLLVGTINNFDLFSVIISLSGSGSADIIAVKLELGSQQTLAHQENGAWVLNEIPRFSDQLAACQRYLIPINNWVRVRASYYSGTALFFTVPIPSTMRTTPAILDPSGALAVQSVSGVDQAGFTFDCNMSTPGSISVRAAKNSHGLTDGQLVKRGGGNFQTAFFSSEL